MTRRRERLVRYHGLWATPATMTEAAAQALLAREDRQYLDMNAVGMRVQALTPGGGPPRIERVER